MHDEIQAAAGQAPASATNAELARVDAQLELAAKKAALADMQRAAARGSGGGAGPAIAGVEAPALPDAPNSTITIDRDGKTITLVNPTSEQLTQLGVATGSSPDVSGWQLVAMTGATMWAIVAIVWIGLWHRRRMRGVGAATPGDMGARMARIENAIESVAVEVERISEGQRFTSRMLSEGAAMPVGVADRGVRVQQNRGDA